MLAHGKCDSRRCLDLEPYQMGPSTESAYVSFGLPPGGSPHQTPFFPSHLQGDDGWDDFAFDDEDSLDLGIEGRMTLTCRCLQSRRFKV